MVVYFDVPGIPGQYFACARYGTMSAGSCAKNYGAAPVAAKTGRLQGCIGCPIGAAHAGGSSTVDAVPAAPVQMNYRPACLRCRRSGMDTGSRLLGRMRLVRGHTICVSCYNREREVLHGANAKGAKPKKWSGLVMLDAAYMRGGRAVRDHMPTPVLDRLEAVLTVLRANKSTSVMWTSPAILHHCAAGA